MATIKTTEGFEVLVDDADLWLVSPYRWRVLHDGYASCRVRDGKKQRTLYMHRLLCGLDFGDERLVDHQNGVKLDNSRANLRVCNKSENGRNVGLRATNTSGYKGITFRKDRGTWDARIRVNGKRHVMSGFKSAEEANTALCLIRDGLHGEFANHG